jgi:hypothetical protein
LATLACAGANLRALGFVAICLQQRIDRRSVISKPRLKDVTLLVEPFPFERWAAPALCGNAEATLDVHGFAGTFPRNPWMN